MWIALRLAKALESVAVRTKANVFFLGEPSNHSKKGSETLEDHYNFGRPLMNLVDHDTDVMAYRTCTLTRGLTKEDLIEGINAANVMDFAR